MTRIKNLISLTVIAAILASSLAVLLPQDKANAAPSGIRYGVGTIIIGQDIFIADNPTTFGTHTYNLGNDMGSLPDSSGDGNLISQVLNSNGSRNYQFNRIYLKNGGQSCNVGSSHYYDSIIASVDKSNNISKYQLVTITDPTACTYTTTDLTVTNQGSNNGLLLSPDGNTISSFNGTVSFTKQSKKGPNGETVYLQTGVANTSCPSMVTISSSGQAALFPMSSTSDADSIIGSSHRRISETWATILSSIDSSVNVDSLKGGCAMNDSLIANEWSIDYARGESHGDFGTTDADNTLCSQKYGDTIVGSSGGYCEAGDGDLLTNGESTFWFSTMNPYNNTDDGFSLNDPIPTAPINTKPVCATGTTQAADGTCQAGDGTDQGTSCNVDGIGWIVCPVMNFIAKLNDAAFSFISGFLETPPGIFGQAQDAWQKFRDVANVLFVIAFLVIVYSQITGAGITNYGLKKMLPKLIIAAVLVNASYILCELAVDITNILGYTLGNFLANDVFKPAAGTADGWATATGGILGGTVDAGIIVALIALVILAPVVLLVLALTFLTLIIRQALIILLIVISPVAFVAYLLPNTEQWFKKWWKMLSTLLLLFPTIAVVFGASTLASHIVENVGAIQASDDKIRGSLTQVVALGIIAVPLFLVPVLLKGALSAAGALGTKISGLQDKARSRAGKSLQGARERYNQRRDMRAVNNAGRGGVRGLVGAGRRFRIGRDQRHEALKKQHGAVIDNFGNTHQRTRDARSRAMNAEETAQKTGEELRNQVKLEHLEANVDLHGRVIESGLNLHNAEETHKNEVSTNHMQTNPHQYDELNTSRGRLKNAQTDTELRHENSAAGHNIAMDRHDLEDRLDTVRKDQKADYSNSTIGQTNYQENRGATARGQIADTRNDNAYKTSAVGAQQTQDLMDHKGEGENIDLADTLRHKQSSVGQSQAQQKRVTQKATGMADTQADIGYEQSSTGRLQSFNSQGLEGQLDIARTENKNAFTGSAAGESLAVRRDAVETQGQVNVLMAENVALQQNAGLHIDQQAAQGDLEIAKAENKNDFAASGNGVDQAVRRDATVTRGNITGKRAEAAALAQNAAVHVEGKAAESELATAQAGLGEQATYANADQLVAQKAAEAAQTTAQTRIDNRATQDNADVLVEQKAAQTELATAQADLDTRALKDNTDELIAQQAAQDTRDATQAEVNALTQEARTEEGAKRLGLDTEEGSVAKRLQDADITKRAQAQRLASATNVANQEYGEKVRSDAKMPGYNGPAPTIAGVAGGVDAQGTTKAKAAAVQTEIEDYRRTVGAVKALNSKTTNESILGATTTDPATGTTTTTPGVLDDATFDRLSTEEVAAQAGLVASRKHRASQIKLQKKLYDQQQRINAMPTGAAKQAAQEKLRNVIQQVSSDRSEAPFGVGDQERGLNEVGEVGAKSMDIYESTRDRVLTHVSASTLSKMDPDDMRLVYEMARDGKLGPSQIEKVKEAYDDWKKSPQLKDSIQDKHRALLDPIFDDNYSGAPTGSIYDLTSMSETGKK